MNKQELKEKLLGQFNKAIVDKLTPPLLAVIDENIESVMDGTTLINGKKAETEEDIMLSLHYGLTKRLAVFQGMINSAKKIAVGNTVINISYCGTSMKVENGVLF